VIAQIYGMVAGVSVVPLVAVLVVSAGCVLMLGCVPYRLARRGQS
jgi:hypothetical protein